MLQSDSLRKSVHVDVVNRWGTGSFASDMARAILDSDLLSTRGVEVLIIPYSRALLKRV